MEKGEHPTQTLLDMYTIHKRYGALAACGLPWWATSPAGARSFPSSRRCANSPAMLFDFVSPSGLRIRPDILAMLDQEGIRYTESNDLAKVAHRVNVVYLTRAQDERRAEGESTDIDGRVWFGRRGHEPTGRRRHDHAPAAQKPDL